MEYHKPLEKMELELSLEIIDSRFLCVLKAIYKKHAVAWANILKDEDCWTLADIYVQDFKRVKFFYKMLSRGLFKNYRSKGIGTGLIKELIIFAKSQGVRKIKGQIVGDVPKLTSWYKSLGFSVNSAYIELNL